MILGRWKQLIGNDVQLQAQIVQARNLEELKAVCKLSEYRLFFTQSKWLEIIKCVDECLQRSVHQHVCFFSTKNGRSQKIAAYFRTKEHFGVSITHTQQQQQALPIYHTLFQRQEESLDDHSSTLNTRPFRTTADRSNW